jgi:hypothetical protein
MFDLVADIGMLNWMRVVLFHRFVAYKSLSMQMELKGEVDLRPAINLPQCNLSTCSYLPRCMFCSDSIFAS